VLIYVIPCDENMPYSVSYFAWAMFVFVRAEACERLPERLPVVPDREERRKPEAQGTSECSARRGPGWKNWEGRIRDTVFFYSSCAAQSSLYSVLLTLLVCSNSYPVACVVVHNLEHLSAVSSVVRRVCALRRNTLYLAAPTVGRIRYPARFTAGSQLKRYISSRLGAHQASRMRM
jgi:hypothetical protein